MQSRQTFMAAMGGVDPGEDMEGYGEYDEVRRRCAPPAARVCFVRRIRAQYLPRREMSPWTGSEVQLYSSLARTDAHDGKRCAIMRPSPHVENHESS